MRYLAQPFIFFWCLVILAAPTACKSSNSPPTQARAPATSGAADSEAPASPRERALAELVTRLLESRHLRQQDIDDGVSEKAFQRFLEQLDPAKMYLLQEDVNSLRQHIKAIDDQLEVGRLTLAHEGRALLAQRIELVGKLVDQHTAKPFDFTRAEFLETDPDKLEYCASEDELSERWRQVLKYDAMLRVVRMDDIARARAKAAEARALAGGKGGGKDGDPQDAKPSDTRSTDPATGAPSGTPGHGVGGVTGANDTGDGDAVAARMDIP
ncbi:MAG: hypothetical protein AAGC55_19350, partial [Myxococcota bacterium]